MVVRPKYCRFAVHNGFIYFNVTLDDEFHGKDFISHKQNFSGQFGTKIDVVPLS